MFYNSINLLTLPTYIYSTYFPTWISFSFTAYPGDKVSQKFAVLNELSFAQDESSFVRAERSFALNENTPAAIENSLTLDLL